MTAVEPRLEDASTAVLQHAQDVLRRCAELRERIAVTRLAGQDAAMPSLMEPLTALLAGGHEILDHCQRVQALAGTLTAEMDALRRLVDDPVNTHTAEGTA